MLIVIYTQMRISGGTAKGRRTATKKLLIKNSSLKRLRPTSAKVREALFDILRNRIDNASFVDLYAGTGTVGLEALSRGAGRAFFIDPDEMNVKAMKKSIQDFGFQERAFVIKGKAYDFLKQTSSENKRYDIFFLDPPYDSVEIEKVMPIIGSEGLLKDDGTVIIEHFYKKNLPVQEGNLIMKRSYRYGDTVLTLYRKKKNEKNCDLSRNI